MTPLLSFCILFVVSLYPLTLPLALSSPTIPLPHSPRLDPLPPPILSPSLSLPHYFSRTHIYTHTHSLFLSIYLNIFRFLSFYSSVLIISLVMSSTVDMEFVSASRKLKPTLSPPPPPRPKPLHLTYAITPTLDTHFRVTHSDSIRSVTGRGRSDL